MSQQNSRISISVLILALGCLILAGAVVVLMLRQFFPDALPVGFMSSVVPAEHSEGVGDTAGRKSQVSHAATLEFKDIERLVSTLPPETRTQLLTDPAAFAELVRKESLRRSVLRAALESDLVTNDRVAYLMDRAADQVLVNGYVQQQTREVIPEEFPSETQIQSFYDQNRAQFTVGERVLLWQVFIPVRPNAGTAAEAERETYANELASKIRSNKLSFTDAALEYTGHEASRLQGGFMGFLSVSQLVPEVREALPTLAEGDVGGPIRGKDGYHIIKRGPLIPEQVLPLAQVREQIRNQLRQLAQRDRQQAVLSATHRKFSESLSERGIEKWRLLLDGQN